MWVLKQSHTWGIIRKQVWSVGTQKKKKTGSKKRVRTLLIKLDADQAFLRLSAKLKWLKSRTGRKNVFKWKLWLFSSDFGPAVKEEMKWLVLEEASRTVRVIWMSRVSHFSQFGYETIKQLLHWFVNRDKITTTTTKDLLKEKSYPVVSCKN